MRPKRNSRNLHTSDYWREQFSAAGIDNPVFDDAADVFAAKAWGCLGRCKRFPSELDLLARVPGRWDFLTAREHVLLRAVAESSTMPRTPWVALPTRVKEAVRRVAQLFMPSPFVLRVSEHCQQAALNHELMGEPIDRDALEEQAWIGRQVAAHVALGGTIMSLPGLRDDPHRTATLASVKKLSGRPTHKSFARDALGTDAEWRDGLLFEFMTERCHVSAGRAFDLLVPLSREELSLSDLSGRLTATGTRQVVEEFSDDISKYREDFERRVKSWRTKIGLSYEQLLLQI